MQSRWLGIIFLRFPARPAGPLYQIERTANFAGKHGAVGSFLAALAAPSACDEGIDVPGAGGQRAGTPGPWVRSCSGQSRKAILKMSARRAVDAFAVVILPVRMPVGRLPIHRLSGWPTRDKPHHSSRAMRRCSRTRRNRSCNASNNSVGSMPYDHRPGRVRAIGRRSTPGQTNSFASSRTIQEFLAIETKVPFDLQRQRDGAIRVVRSTRDRHHADTHAAVSVPASCEHDYARPVLACFSPAGQCFTAPEECVADDQSRKWCARQRHMPSPGCRRADTDARAGSWPPTFPRFRRPTWRQAA